MKMIDNEEVTFESFDDHFYKFDQPEVLEPELEPGQSVAPPSPSPARSCWP